MQTDWVLIGRLAEELRARLRGARLDDAGLLPDGRIALLMRRRDQRLLLAVDLFESPPLVTLEEGELGVNAEPSFVRVLARSLRGMVLADAAGRRSDRLLRLTFASRSRFGVSDQLELYLELVPRFGNVVLVKGDVVVAAAKEFAPAENPRRPIQPGSPYVLPPLPAEPRMLPTQPSGSALEFFKELRVQRAIRSGEERFASRRRSMLKRLDERQRKLRTELDALAEQRRRADERGRLRTEGNDILATLYALPEQDRTDAKERAAKLFAAYKRLAKSLPHIDAREAHVRALLDAVDSLQWETERASGEDLDSVQNVIEQLGHKRAAHASGQLPRRRRAPLEFRTSSGSRIVVGRSPLENAELTFRVARANDLWFHAQGTPGAHVILLRDDRLAAPEEDVEAAAALAAFHSRGRRSGLVPVDYTQRKHVRKQRAAPPGLVWYTHAKTIVIAPGEDPFAERATMTT